MGLQTTAEGEDWRQVVEEGGKGVAALRERLPSLESLGMWNVPWTVCPPGSTTRTWKWKDSVRVSP